MVIVVFLLFEIWFFFSTSPIDSRSGRGALDVVAVDAPQGRSVSVVNRPPPLYR